MVCWPLVQVWGVQVALSLLLTTANSQNNVGKTKINGMKTGAKRDRFDWQGRFLGFYAAEQQSIFGSNAVWTDRNRFL